MTYILKNLGLITWQTGIWLLVWTAIVALVAWPQVRRNGWTRSLAVPLTFLVFFGAVVAAIINPLFLSARVAKERTIIIYLRRALDSLNTAETESEFNLWVADYDDGDYATGPYQRWGSLLRGRHVAGRGRLLGQNSYAKRWDGAEREIASAEFRLEGKGTPITIRVIGVGCCGEWKIGSLRQN